MRMSRLPTTALSLAFLATTPFFCNGSGQEVILLDNGFLELEIERNGGHYTGIRLPGLDLNPLSWALTPAQMPANNRNGAPFKGHFLCLGRWGAPSEGEIAAGIPHNGEQSNTVWSVSSISKGRVAMSNTAPLDGLAVKRTVQMLEELPAFLVREDFINTFSLGRVSNVVQHVTVGPPFLSKSTLVNSNADKGFNQQYSYPDPHAHAYDWPVAVIDAMENRTTDARRTDEDINYVSTHLIQEDREYGWITAYDPESGLLLGYVWRKSDYPWVNIWNHYENGSPAAKGLEFGTTGIGRPYKDLLETDTRFHGVNSWEYIDAGEVIRKSYLGFLINHGKGQSNPQLEVTESSIRIGDRKLMDNPLKALF